MPRRRSAESHDDGEDGAERRRDGNLQQEVRHREVRPLATWTTFVEKIAAV
jgi:hypothetical protein